MDVALPTADAELAQLADGVWVERTVTEHLAFKLAALELVLTAGLRRYVGRCLDEVDDAWDQLGRVEARRGVALDALAAAWHRPPSSLRLRDLVTDAPEPWATVFADHRDHLRLLLAEIERTTAENARLCATTLRHVDDDLGAIDAATRRSLDLRDSTAVARPPLRLVATLDAGDAERAAELRGEIALLEDLALPEAVSEVRLHRLSYTAAHQAMARPLPESLVAFLT